MKILIVRPSPNKMNLNTYNLQEIGLAKALIRKGHSCDVMYYCGRENDHIETIKFDDSKELHILWLHGLGMFKEGIYPTLNRYVDNYDIVQVGGYVGLVSCWLNLHYPQKTVNYQGPYYFEKNKGDIKKAAVFDKVLLPLQRKKNMIVATKSILATEYIKNKGISNVTTIGVGLDLDNLERVNTEKNIFVEDLKKGKKDNKYLLYIGVLEPRRNILFLLEVFSKIVGKDDAYRLVLIGNGKDDYKLQVDNKIKKLNLESNVIRSPKIEQKFMSEIYRTCDAFLLPTRYEIFGMVLLEAMYYGLPVFTTYNGGSSTIMNDENGVIIKDLDVKLWSDKILEIMSNKEIRHDIGVNAHKKIAKEFTWDALADKFLDVYNKRLEMKDKD